MKIAYNWLKKYLTECPAPEELSTLLTDSGLEVEHVETFETVKGMLKGVVVGEVLWCEQHPNADRLRVTKVNVGEEQPLNIVCGAPNVAVGQKVLVATTGTTLYPNGGEPLLIKESKIRGELSQGMICAEDELGLGKSHEGIMVLPSETPVGIKASDLFKLFSDTVFEIGLTPNRIDAASHIGVARDVAAVLYKQPQVTLVKPNPTLTLDLKNHGISVEINSPQALKRYATVRISEVKVCESPDWLKNALKSIGLRPINAIVDICNFVLHETGQPLHAFDAAKINGNKLVVGTCEEGTSFTTLDGSEITLSSEDLVISNVSDPMCLAGIYGGINSGVGFDTTDILLESAHFDSVLIRKSSKRHNLKTDSSFRFERGADPDSVFYALQRAAEFILEICGGQIEGATDYYPKLATPVKVEYKWAAMNRLIGAEIPVETAILILKRLEINVLRYDEACAVLEIPPFKTGVELEADVTEEILRIYGYNNIELPSQMRVTLAPESNPNADELFKRISAHLCGMGFMEALNNSLTSHALTLLPDDAVKIANPLSSELDALRMSLLPALLENVAWNKNRQISTVKFFEKGKIYRKSNNTDSNETPFLKLPFKEVTCLALVWSGKDFSENWVQKQQNVQRAHLQGAVNHVFNVLGIAPESLTQKHVEDGELDASVEIFASSQSLARVGSVKPSLLKKFGIEDSVFFAEMNWDAMLKSYANARIVYAEVPKYPSVRRDLSMVLDEAVSYEQIRTVALKTERKLIREINLFDVYQGDKLPHGKKSYAVSFVFRDDEQTLNDKIIEKMMDKIIQSLHQQLGAELRN
jgi:phenylalanyl-tRNA synthetase beta chain